MQISVVDPDLDPNLTFLIKDSIKFDTNVQYFIIFNDIP
jgi:hypothetical protein